MMHKASLHTSAGHRYHYNHLLPRVRHLQANAAVAIEAVLHHHALREGCLCWILFSLAVFWCSADVRELIDCCQLPR